MKFIGKIRSFVLAGQKEDNTTHNGVVYFILSISDIGANLTDKMFRGRYNGSQKHPADYAHVMQRAWDAGLQKIIITVGTMKEADAALGLASEDGKYLTKDSNKQSIIYYILRRHQVRGPHLKKSSAIKFRPPQNTERLYITAGCHPTRCNDFVADPDAYLGRIDAFITAHRDKVVALGEFGLDYDRLKFCAADTQRTYFELQLGLLARHPGLPLFLHCRNAFDDFYAILLRHEAAVRRSGGVVHSFDGNAEQAEKLCALGLHLGLNGCSLKTAAQLETVAALRPDRLMLETDCPWCSIRPSHAGAKLVRTHSETVKRKEKWRADALIDGRSEPSQIRQVLEVVAAVQGRDAAELAEQVYRNTIDVFFTKAE